MNPEISAPAALEVSRTQQSGYRGLALLHDPHTHHLILFRVQDYGSDCIAVTQAPEHDCDLQVIELPELVLPTGIAPVDAFMMADMEIRRMAARMVN